MPDPSDTLVARALAAPTRVQILDRLRSAGPADVREAAEAAGVHPNVARGHLDVLVSAGLATVTERRSASGGRPAKVYEAAPVHVADGPLLVSEMLATMIEAAAPSPIIARRIAVQAGERLAQRLTGGGDTKRSFAESVELLTRALSTLSGGIRVTRRGDDWVEIEDLDCPFKTIAHSHPELACSLDKALKEGIMRGLGVESVVEMVSSIAWGDPTCAEVVKVATDAAAEKPASSKKRKGA
jgi:predicted ArsR family transcriptional regulator